MSSPARFRWLTLWITFTALAHSSAANAQEFLVLSWGQDTCGQYVQADESQKSIYVTWALGYIAGANSRDHGTGRMAGNGWEQAAVTVWLQNYCNDHPLARFLTAAELLRHELGGNLLPGMKNDVRPRQNP